MRLVAGVGIVVASVTDCNETRGINTPLSEAVISSSADGLGLVVPIPTLWVWALAAIAHSANANERTCFFIIAVFLTNFLMVLNVLGVSSTRGDRLVMVCLINVTQ